MNAPCPTSTTDPTPAGRDSALLRSIASSMSYGETADQAVTKHRLHEIAMRIETGYYARQLSSPQTDPIKP